MTIENEQQLRHAYQSIVHMYQLCDQLAVEPTGHPSTRAEEIEGVKAMIRKIERQIAAYFAAHPERAA